ncbi:hypothetical protein HPP92_028768 [Vanilla planifolia]|uniref:Glucose-6-phosphate dehydrogenase (NADP(+)) n=1 Tax=Vanilla planifolia TaxID=51239 RepID=A0A835U577_VANPL|nr:hypothetical protein HPP92_028768 [Vanilla planifolia]
MASLSKCISSQFAGRFSLPLTTQTAGTASPRCPAAASLRLPPKRFFNERVWSGSSTRRHWNLESSLEESISMTYRKDVLLDGVENGAAPFTLTSESQEITGISGGTEYTVSIIIVGASGDLARKKIFPALFALFYEECLPKVCYITTYSENCSEKMDQFLERCFYYSGQYNSEDDFTNLDEKLKEHEAGRLSNRLFCLSIPPNIFIDVVNVQATQLLLEEWLDKEDFGTEGRGGYFDNYGIIRDIMQNHLLQILALFAMETPVSLDAEDIRNEKVKVLRSMRPLQMEDVVIGQYKSHTRAVVTYPGYTDDKTVPNGSLTPTFAAACLFIDNARWDGVPFLMKAGKALHTKRVQPDEAIYLKINNKVPGLGMRLDCSTLNLHYAVDRKDTGYQTVSTQHKGYQTLFESMASFPSTENSRIPKMKYKGSHQISYDDKIGPHLTKSTSSWPARIDLCGKQNEFPSDVEALHSSNNYCENERIITECKTKTRVPKEIPDAYERLLLDAIERGERRLFIRSDELDAAQGSFTPLLKELEESKIAPELYPYGGRGPLGAHYLAAKHNVRWGDLSSSEY